MRKKAVISVLALSVLATSAFVVSGTFFKGKATEATLTESVAIEEMYAQGTKLTLPSATIAYGQESKDAEIILHYPNNKSYITVEHNLQETGLYTVEYRAEFDGKWQSVFDTFYVYAPAYNLQGSNPVSYYGANKKDVKAYGLNIELKRNDLFRYSYPIDLNDFDRYTPTVSIQVVPSEQGKYDFTELYVRFIDAYDESNYVTTKIHNIYKAYDGVSYMLVGSAKQPLTGRDWQRHDDRLFVEEYGCSCGSTLNGTRNPAYGEDNCEIFWEYDERRIYGTARPDPSVSTMAADLDDLEYYSTLWDGFTTGEVFVEIWTSENSNVGNLCIKSIGNHDLSKTYLEENTVPPKIEIDVDETKVPTGVVGQKYTLFDATVYDFFSDYVKLEKKVYRNYGTTSAVEIDCAKGYFQPTKAGRYTIEYTAINQAQGKTIKTVSVNVEKSAPTLCFGEINPLQTTGIVGLTIEIADYSVSNNGCGLPTVTTLVKHKETGTEIPLIENDGISTFLPIYAGKYEVTYLLMDYIGQEDEFTYEITVSLKEDGAVINESPILPRYFIDGEKYVLPLHYGIRYLSDGSTEEVVCGITVIDANGTTVLGDDRVYYPKLSNSVTTAMVIYTAGENGLSYQTSIPIVNVKGEDGKLALAYYFQTKNGMLTKLDRANNKNIVFTATKDGSSAEFINKLLLDQFYVRLRPVYGEDSKRVDLYLTDAYNSKKVIKFSFMRNVDPKKCDFSVNDGKIYTLEIPFSSSNENQKLLFTYSATLSRITINNDVFTLFLDDSPLKDAREVYFRFEVSGMSNSASIELDRLCGQIFTGKTNQDAFAPLIATEKELPNRLIVGETLYISLASSLDVLAPCTNITVSVYDQDNKPVRDIQSGELLEEVAPNKTYAVLCDRIGEYYVIYKARAMTGKTATLNHTVNVVDNIPPVIQLSEAMVETAKVGSFIRVSKATATDTVDKEVDLFISIILPNGIMQVFDMQNYSGFTAKEKGEYTVIYMAWDKTGNYTVERYVIKVS